MQRSPQEAALQIHHLFPGVTRALAGKYTPKECRTGKTKNSPALPKCYTQYLYSFFFLFFKLHRELRSLCFSVCFFLVFLAPRSEEVSCAPFDKNNIVRLGSSRFNLIHVVRFKCSTATAFWMHGIKFTSGYEEFLNTHHKKLDFYCTWFSNFRVSKSSSTVLVAWLLEFEVE